jgi:hypothetical protein
MLDEWLDQHPDCRLVEIDVFARVRGQGRNGGSAYEADYEDASVLKALGDKHRVPFLTTHHDRKADAEDFVASVSGTHGLAGAAGRLFPPSNPVPLSPQSPTGTEGTKGTGVKGILGTEEESGA